MDRKSFGLILAVVVIALVLANLFDSVGPRMLGQKAAQQAQPVVKTVSYDQIVNEIKSNPQGITKVVFVRKPPLEIITEVRVEHADNTINVAAVPGDSHALVQAAINAHLTVSAVTYDGSDASSTFWAVVINFLPLLLLLGFFIWMVRRAQKGPGGALGRFGQSGAQQVQPNQERITFRDVAGCENAKRELQDVIEYLRNPNRVKRLGGKPMKGVLLVGEPGNGKTLLAKAVAGEAGVPFFAVSGSQFVEMFVGVGASRVRDAFNQARARKPAILFIDEIDAIGRQRGTGLGGGNDEREQTLNQILVEMDGFQTAEGLVVIAATNRPDILDPALVRPGRFDLHVLVDHPDLQGRVAIFKIHTRGMPLAPDVDLVHLGMATPGFSGAQIAGACAQAAHIANRRISDGIRVMKQDGKSEEEIKAAFADQVNSHDFDEGITRVQMGPASDKIMSDKDKKNTAYHELGHAYVSQVRYNEGKGGDPVTKITIVPRARALGYTQALPKGDRYNYTKEELTSRIMMAMGGRVAQEVFLNTVDTGASNDFEQAWNIAYQMVTKFGMSEELGPISVGDPGPNPFLGRMMAQGHELSPELRNKVDQATQALINKCYIDTKALIERDRACFQSIADLLIRQETILGPQWETLFNELTCQRDKIVHQEPAEEVKSTATCEECGGAGEKNEPDAGANDPKTLMDRLDPARLLGGVRLPWSGKKEKDAEPGNDGKDDKDNKDAR